MKPWMVAAGYAALILAVAAYLRHERRRQDREWAAVRRRLVDEAEARQAEVAMLERWYAAQSAEEPS